MSKISQSQSAWERFRPLLMSAFGLAALLFLSYWAGFPRELFVPFLIGLALLALFLAGYGWLGYHLLARPLPAGHKNPALNMLPAAYRRLLAIILGIGGMGVTVGGTWDEVWHRAYGIPFGEDFFWRPHILLYIGLLTPPLLAIISLFWVMRGSKGTMQQKLRADPSLAFLIMAGMLLAVSVPADPLWHVIYGVDLSAWSIPHLILLICVSLVMFVAAFVQLTTLKLQEWRGVWRASPETWLIVLFLTFSLATQLQLTVTDWESFSPMTQLRPFWLLPALVVVVATFTGSIANRATRTYGAATIITIISIAIRWGLTRAFDYQVPLDAWLPIIAPMVGLDVWFAFRANKGGVENPILNSVAANIPLILISFPLIHRLFPYLHLAGRNAVVSALICLVAGTAGAWIGQAIGDGLNNAPRQVEAESPMVDQLRVVTPGLFAAAVVFMVFFVLTATPPV